MTGLLDLSERFYKESKFKKLLKNSDRNNQCAESNNDAYIVTKKIVVPKEQPKKVRNPKDAIVINYRPLHYC